MTMANSGLPYPVRWSAGECSQIELPGVPLGSFPGSTYDEVTFSLQRGEVYVFCTDGVFEAMNELAQEFTAGRLLDVVQRSAQLPAAEIVSAIFQAVAEGRGAAPPNDDMTAVVVRITA
jgi:sigma-B regulation protein RsbU (phosphoserine phosphatase)